MKTLTDHRRPAYYRDEPKWPVLQPPTSLSAKPSRHVLIRRDLLRSRWAGFVLCPSFERVDGPTRAVLGFMHGFDTVHYGVF